MKHTHPKLRWGYSTGACAAAAATAAWLKLTGLARDARPSSVWVCFLDGMNRELPLRTDSAHMAAIVKDGGDDPDCTHGVTVYADIRPCRPGDRQDEDYALTVGDGLVILRAVEGIGLCTRQGLDCDEGRWAITTGPRRMIAGNLRAAGLGTGCWLLEIGVEHGERLAKHTLNAHLGVVGGLSLLGTTGLVRPYSHEAYIHTIDLCVKSHACAGASTVVFCTGGRSRAGAEARLPRLPRSAFIPIGDFVAESLTTACRHGMKEIVVACMPGKLCKYAAGCANTHARRVRQDRNLLLAEVVRTLPAEKSLHRKLEHSASVREALLSIPESAQDELLRRLARRALEHFARRCTGGQSLRLLIFDFQGEFLLEEARNVPARDSAHGDPPPASRPARGSGNGDAGQADAGASLSAADTTRDGAPDEVGPSYFMRRPAP